MDTSMIHAVTHYRLYHSEPHWRRTPASLSGAYCTHAIWTSSVDYCILIKHQPQLADA